jgi:4-carboxymuconolactone decarboxylase
MDQLYRHINCALNIGVTPDEVHEILLHVGNYAGLPKWENGVAVANEVFVARGILPAGSGVTVVPKPPMTHEERLAAMKRVTTAMNIGRIGQGAEAPVLQPLAGGVPSVTAAVNMPVASDMAQINGSHGFGELWGRPGLELRTRSFITFTVLQVLVQTHEITVHINIALNLGISPEAVYEALEQAGIYGGFSGWHNATLVAAHVFAQHKAVRGQRSAA